MQDLRNSLYAHQRRGACVLFMIGPVPAALAGLRVVAALAQFKLQRDRVPSDVGLGQTYCEACRQQLALWAWQVRLPAACLRPLRCVSKLPSWILPCLVAVQEGEDTGGLIYRSACPGGPAATSGRTLSIWSRTMTSQPWCAASRSCQPSG